MSEPDDHDLVTRARAGSKEALGELFSRHWTGAWRAAYGLTSDRATADDVAQDAFERAIRNLDRLVWRPLELGTADRRGRFSVRYRFSPGTDAFTVPMRIVVPREKGWPFLPIVAARFDVRVA